MRKFPMLIISYQAVTVWALDAVQQGVLMNVLYFYTITGYNTPSTIMQISG